MTADDCRQTFHGFRVYPPAPWIEDLPLRVLLADDHDLVRDAISSLLLQHDPAMHVVVAPDLQSALDRCRSEDLFDIVILDLNMPGMEGLTGVRKMLETCRAPLMLMSGSARRENIRAALDLGAKGFIPKTLAGKALINAVGLVAAGETYVPTSFLNGDLDEASELTARELQVLGQLRHGTGNKEIARNLGITETTVKLHLRNIGEKLDAKNRLEIAIKAIDRGIV